jgi:hypothetical protein
MRLSGWCAHGALAVFDEQFKLRFEPKRHFSRSVTERPAQG